MERMSRPGNFPAPELRWRVFVRVGKAVVVKCRSWACAECVSGRGLSQFRCDAEINRANADSAWQRKGDLPFFIFLCDRAGYLTINQ